jgi:hypothetical protein
MARRVKGENREAKNNGRRAPAAKAGGTPGPRRAGPRKTSSAGSPKGRSKDQAEGQGNLHQRIAERAYSLYEQSGFQHGNDVEHWLEAERQVKDSGGHVS